MEEKNKLLTIGQAANRLGVSTTTLRMWDKNGELPALRIGTRKDKGDRRYRPQDLEAYLRDKIKKK